MGGLSDLSEKIKNKKYNNKEFRLLWSDGSPTAEINSSPAHCMEDENLYIS